MSLMGGIAKDWALYLASSLKLTKRLFVEIVCHQINIPSSPFPLSLTTGICNMLILHLTALF